MDIKPRILVVGSANMDTTQKVDNFPNRFRKKIIGKRPEPMMVLGGKGFNQARAIKLQNPDAEVAFVGCIGDDAAGKVVLQEMSMVGSYYLRDEKGNLIKDEAGNLTLKYMPGFTEENIGLDYSGVIILENCKTDGRIITVNSKGENSMVGKSGDCIKQLKPDLIPLDKLEWAEIIAIQLKMPAETAEFLINYCDEHNKKIIIDPTPQENSEILIKNALLSKAAYLTPNEEEAFALIGYMEGKSIEEIESEFLNTPREKRMMLIEQLVQNNPNVIATIGEEGVIYNDENKIIKQETYPTICVDSTGAGDTFNGGFVGALSRSAYLKIAIKYGLMASSMKVRFEGAQNGVPTYKETRDAIIAHEKAQQKEHEEVDFE